MINEKIFVPPLKIQGIKTKLVPLIKQNMILESDTIWIEPFMGSGVVGFNLAPAKAIFSDKNPHIINFYNSIKNKTINSKIVKEFLKTEGEKLSKIGSEYYYQVRNRFNEKTDSLDFLFLNRSCFNGMMRFNKKHEFNVPFCHKTERFSKAYITKIVNQVLYIEKKLEICNWEFVNQSFEKALSKIQKNSFIYCDPPYIGRHVDYYDSWDENLEKLLYEKLLNSGVKFMLSTWHSNKYRKNEYIDKIWKFCNIIKKEHFYFIGAKEQNRNSITEALLVNYNTQLKINKIKSEEKNMQQLELF